MVRGNSAAMRIYKKAVHNDKLKKTNLSKAKFNRTDTIQHQTCLSAANIDSLQIHSLQSKY